MSIIIIVSASTKEERRESSQVKFLFAYWAVQWSWIARVNNNNNGHFYGAWSLARSRAECAVQKAAEKCINTYNRQNKKGFGPYDRQPRKKLHTAISVNKPKLSVTKHDQTLILAHIYDTSRYTADTKMYSGILHTQTHTHNKSGNSHAFKLKYCVLYCLALLKWWKT